MKKIVPWLAAIAVLAVVGGGLYGWWAVDLRWRPHTIKTHQAEIAKALEGAGWVSPKLGPNKLYMVSYRSCPDCIRFEDEVFPKLQAAGVDTRVIMIARADHNGQSKSTPPERATVAELWINKSWKLYQDWAGVKPATAWTAPGVPAADGDTARTAVVDAGRNLVEQLRPLLKDNGVNFAYPTLIWWDKKGVMRGCACEKAQTYRYVLKELGAS
ncbi:hypothetical protein ACO2Q3_16205 [Caulobacter sp. KR2-114]|uniref:hypothetical protein n=1 Tax=Caulobacter sp. KR2-114 TaxID=3400912 RepID=UPI003C0A3EFA